MIVHIDDPLACHKAIRKGYYSRVAVHAGVDNKAWSESYVNLADIANRCPDIFRTRLDQGFFMYGSHLMSPVCAIAGKPLRRCFRPGRSGTPRSKWDCSRHAG